MAIDTPFERGLAVLQAFSAQEPCLSASRISHKTGIPRPAVARCLYTLQQLGFVYQETAHQFRLAAKVLTLGYRCLASASLARASQAVLSELTDRVNASCVLTVLEHESVQAVAYANPRQLSHTRLEIGARFPAYCTAAGRVLLAFGQRATRDNYLDRMPLQRHTRYTLTDHSRLEQALDTVHAQGYALCDQELELGLCSVAVPIKDQHGVAQAALSLLTPSDRSAGLELLPLLRNAAEELELLTLRHTNL